MTRVGIVGGGAAGMFAAVSIMEMVGDISVTVLERGRTPLRKVALTGGGRCNLTNTFAEVRSMEQVYPRGATLMKRLLRDFGPDATRAWFAAHGVPTVVQGEVDPTCAASERQCVFPRSQDATTVVRCLEREAQRLGVRVVTGTTVTGITATPVDGRPTFAVATADRTLTFDVVVVATGGNGRDGGASMLSAIEGVEIVPPVPSLFPLAIDDADLKAMMGTVADDVTVGLAGTKMRARGALLVTHWGVSGPAVLRLSSYAARVLDGLRPDDLTPAARPDERPAQTLVVNWAGAMTPDDVVAAMRSKMASDGGKLVTSASPVDLPRRLWEHIVRRSQLAADVRWGSLGRRQTNRLATATTACEYRVTGRWRHKDEFVTAGGVALGCLSPSLEARSCPGLYVVGEAADVDGVTGGFNLQAAWSMAHAVARDVARGRAHR